MVDKLSLTVLSSNGKKLRSLGCHSSSMKHLFSPRGVAVDRKGDILIADMHNHCIQKFTACGDFLTVVRPGGLSFIALVVFYTIEFLAGYM